jgi:hypothetical protein
MSHWNDGLPNIGDEETLDDGSMWKLTKCGWTFIGWEKDETKNR